MTVPVLPDIRRTVMIRSEVNATEKEPLAYRLITGPDDQEFCRRVSEALAEGYELHGSPALSTADGRVVVGQAVVRSEVRP